MSDLLSEGILTNITDYIFKIMKNSPECHVLGGRLNPYDFLNIAIDKSESYWLPTIQKNIPDTDDNIYEFEMTPFRNGGDGGATIGFKISANVVSYDDSHEFASFTYKQLQNYRFPEDVLNKFYTQIASLVQYYINDKAWLEKEIGSSTTNIPIFHADRFKTTDKDGNVVPISTQIDVEAYQREQQSSQTEQQQTYGNIITVMRPSIQTITDGVDTFMHKDYIEVLLPNGQYIATCVAVPSDEYSIFAFDTLYSEKVKMKTAGGISGGYEASNLRSYLQALYNSFPDDIKKKCIPFDNGDYLSIPTIAQLFGVDNMQNAVTGQIEYFKDRYHRIAYLDGDWCSYWCQDTSINHTFIICNKGGDFDYANSNNEEVGVRILFKLKNDSNKKVKNKTGN